MVEVGHVRMHMCQRFMAMNVLMTHQLSRRMVVSVMAIVVNMFVVVLDGHVSMLVQMVATQHEADPDRRDHQ